MIIEDESEVGDIEDQMKSFEANIEQEVKEEIFWTSLISKKLWLTSFFESVGELKIMIKNSA